VNFSFCVFELNLAEEFIGVVNFVLACTSQVGLGKDERLSLLAGKGLF